MEKAAGEAGPKVRERGPMELRSSALRCSAQSSLFRSCVALRPALEGDIPVHVQQAIRRALDRVVGADARQATGSKPLPQRAVSPQLVQPLGEALGAVWIDQQPAASLVDDLDEGAAPGLHDRHPTR